MASKNTLSNHNARITMAVSFLEDLSFIIPIWMLFGINDLGLSASVTTILFMSIWLTSGLLEIPTGALADRLGRKRIFLIGVTLMMLYPLAYAFKLPIAAIAIVSILSGVGSALRSGTLIPLVHESFKHDNRGEKQYHTFLSNSYVLIFLARVLSGITGGLLYVYDPRAPYIGGFVVYVALFVVGLRVIESPRTKSDLSNNAHITKTLRLMRRTPIIVSALSAYIAAQLVGEAMWTAYQPFFSADGWDAQVIGTIFSAIAAISALSAYAVRHIMRHFGALQIQELVAALMFSGALLLYLPWTTGRLLSVVPAALAFGISVLPIKAVVQKMIDGAYHSTALSVISVMQYVVYAIASLYISGLIDLLGSSQTRLILLALAACASLIVTVVYVFLIARTVWPLPPPTKYQHTRSSNLFAVDAAQPHRYHIHMIEVDGVSKVYGKKQNIFSALKDVSLTVQDGETIAIIGKSGSGKSTLMHVMSGLDHPTSGVVRVNGQDLSTLKAKALDAFRAKEMGFIFQSFFVEPKQTCFQNVMLPLEIARIPRRKRRKLVVDALTAVDLAEKINQPAANLSGGQRQRLAIARSIVNQPKLIFADEPTGNLDSVTGDKIIDLLFDLNKRLGVTLVVVTHDHDLASRCGRQVQISDGELQTSSNRKSLNTTPEARK